MSLYTQGHRDNSENGGKQNMCVVIPLFKDIIKAYIFCYSDRQSLFRSLRILPGSSYLKSNWNGVITFPIDVRHPNESVVISIICMENCGLSTALDDITR